MPIQSTAPRRSFGYLAVVVVLCPLVGAGAGWTRQQEPPVFRSEVGITRIKVAVLDDDGNPVAGLTVDDFRIFEDGHEQKPQLVLDPVRVSMDVALVLDFSESVRRDWSAEAAREAARGFLDSLDPDDCVYLLPFHRNVGPGVWGSPDADELRWKIEEYPFEVYTRLYDAILNAHNALDQRRPDSASAAAEELDAMMGTWMEPVRETACGEPLSPEEALERRAALVVLTDGEDVGSVASYSDVLMASWRAEVPVFAMAVGMAAQRPSYRGGGWSSSVIRGATRARISREAWENIRTLQGQLREIARVSGGQLVVQRDLRDGYADTLGLLRAYYVVAYPSPEDAEEGWHELEVEIEGRGRHAIVQPGIYRTRTEHVATVSSLREASVQYKLGNYEGALEQFDFATRTNPDIGSPFFGRGLVLEKLTRWEEARYSYERSLQTRPGAAMTHARLAEVTFQLGDHAAAWEHAIRAHRGGISMVELVERLEKVSVAPLNHQERLAGPVVYLLEPRVPELESQLALRDVLRELTAALDAEPMVGLIGVPVASDFTISVWVRSVSDDPPRKMRARLVVVDRREGRTHQEPFEVVDLEDLTVVEAAVRKSVGEAVEWILEQHRKR